MRQELSRNRVHGFLHADGMLLKNDRGETVQLLGWGLGNWLLCEGYMWGMGDLPQFDRPRRIEAVIEDLVGAKFAARFWKQYRENYVTENDLNMMADMGFNCVRVPLNARLLLEEGPEIRFIENGFVQLELFLDACEKAGLYVWLDLHAAPGGQTGANIDDSRDDLCRLLIDEEQFQRGLLLWEEIARRFKERWIVAGYDLLNEPIRPVRFPGDTDLDEYVPRLRNFYEQAICRIRSQDNRHLISLEGIHWATGLGIFDHRYDEQMVMQFHCYACPPELSTIQRYLDCAKALDVPVWLGETGENTDEWLGAIVPLALSEGIHVTAWPWKKMDTKNSPCSIKRPENWQQLQSYLEGGAQPDYDRAQQILSDFLINIRAENCDVNSQLTSQMLRTPFCQIQGTDFDENTWNGNVCQPAGEYPAGIYRQSSGMHILSPSSEFQKRFPFDGPWREAVLVLHAGEWAQYTFYDVTSSCKLEMACKAEQPAQIEVSQNEQTLGIFDLSGCGWEQVISGMHLYTAEKCRLCVKVLDGSVQILNLSIQLVPAI